MPRTRNILILFVVFATQLMGSGCAAIKAQLRPLVCECSQHVEGMHDGDPDEDVAAALALHQVEGAVHQAEHSSHHGGENPSAEAIADDPDNPQPAERAQATFNLDPIDPLLADARLPLDSDQDRAAFQERFGVAPPSSPDAHAFQGRFRRGDDSSLALYSPGESLTIYSEGQTIARLNLDRYQTVPLPEELIAEDLRAIDIVRNDMTQLQLVHAQVDDDETTYYVGIYQLFGEFVGTIFHKAIAHQSADGTFTRLADMRFLRGEDQAIIQWIPLDEGGQPSGEPLLYEWNRWEGVYRIPGPPPTAPNRSQPQSHLPAFEPCRLKSA